MKLAKPHRIYNTKSFKRICQYILTLSKTVNADLQVYNMLGKIVKVVLNKLQLNPGEYIYNVNISSLKADTYLCKLNVEGIVKSKILLKL